jgi:polysaccharide biosynthesis protein PslH
LYIYKALTMCSLEKITTKSRLLLIHQATNLLPPASLYNKSIKTKTTLSNMKILQLCKKFPYPLKDGESIAVTYLSKALTDLGCKVTLLAMNTPKHHIDIENLHEDFDHYDSINTVNVDNGLNVFKAFANIFSKDSYHVSRFISEEYKEKLIKLLTEEDYDIIQLETLYLAPYIPTIKKYSKAIISMRSHNIEFEIWERITSNTSNGLKKWYLKYLTSKLKRYEVASLNDYDYLVAISDRDLTRFKQLGYRNGSITTPIGLELDAYTYTNKAITNNNLCFIGSLDWRPNIEGVDWFTKEVWPLIQKKNRNIRLNIAGRNTPEDLVVNKIPNINIVGEVNDAIDFINSHTIMIVPLLSGSGMRVKILEGLALGKTVITTSLGLEGINAEHEKHLLIADTPEEFKNAILRAYNDATLRYKIGKNAKEFIHTHFDQVVIAKNLFLKYQELITNVIPDIEEEATEELPSIK